MRQYRKGQDAQVDKRGGQRHEASIGPTVNKSSKKKKTYFDRERCAEL